jgi:hypothetical protein
MNAHRAVDEKTLTWDPQPNSRDLKFPLTCRLSFQQKCLVPSKQQRTIGATFSVLHYIKHVTCYRQISGAPPSQREDEASDQSSRTTWKAAAKWANAFARMSGQCSFSDSSSQYRLSVTASKLYGSHGCGRAMTVLCSKIDEYLHICCTSATCRFARIPLILSDKWWRRALHHTGGWRQNMNMIGKRKTCLHTGLPERSLLTCA